ncbi:L-alanine-DL-glutamate epimerase [Caldicoprobacter faecalis]|uniref:L-alanine-DL-glutamate epimerase n=1 Tax=Caldicoprobacter faecalis TaxID=937334 RepID=A0A1I5TH04_9FIRM|nr:L-alanine-DL-glutamate epimerase [Caldicoprobacter faecalis]
MSVKNFVKPIKIELYFIPVTTRVPLKFGSQVLTTITCARVHMFVADRDGRIVDGWGETPLSVQWAWPSSISYESRHADMKNLCKVLADEWLNLQLEGHPVEVGYLFTEHVLPLALVRFNSKFKGSSEDMPWLAALICNSPFDIAFHDAYAKYVGVPVYKIYGKDLIEKDLSHYLEPAEGGKVSFEGKTIQDFLRAVPRRRLVVWHLVGGTDPVTKEELTGNEPNDGYPVLLEDWINQDGLKCLKIKLKGNDFEWDYNRIVKVARVGIDNGVLWLSVDFNCTVKDPAYVVEILDRLLYDEPEVYARILYIEQPFPYDLEASRIDVRPIANRKPIFMDESAHDWKLVRLGREDGWSGVALKTCKTQTSALLTYCWAKAHGMTVMVQDLTNPMLAQIPHVLLASHVDTIMGVESNAMQFYPSASEPEAKVHSGLYKRRDGVLDLSTIKGPGFGYRVEEIPRELPEPHYVASR